MADTRNPSGHPDNLLKERSLLRSSDFWASRRSVDKRPAGPSAKADPGMGSPTTPLPPGVKGTVWRGGNAHPKVAGNFRYDFALGPQEDPPQLQRQEEKADER